MKASTITIILRENKGQAVLDHVIAGDIELKLAASLCRAVADRLDTERIRAEMHAEAENDDA